jgi:hypothetical protein
MRRVVIGFSFALAATAGLVTGCSSEPTPVSTDPSIYVVQIGDTVPANNSLTGLNAICNPGDTGLGGGFMMPSPVDLHVSDSSPYLPGDATTPTGWNGSFVNRNNSPSPVYVYAICKDT